MIDPAQIAEVKTAINLVELVEQYALVKKSGSRYVALCPFHLERSPSFSINPQMGVYHCFGCKASGDAITFLQQISKLSFEDAVITLADRAGIHLEIKDRGPDRRPQYTALQAAAEYYHQQLLISPLGKVAQRYLTSRGITEESFETFQIGVSPPQIAGLIKACKVRHEVLQSVGLIQKRQGKFVDPLAGRVIFPIRDHMDRVVAFGGRVLSSAAPGGKYINTKETDLFHKSNVLYNLNLARRDIVKQDTVVIVEGYMDVVHLHQAGHNNAVAPMGTALTTSHLQLLSRFAQRIILLLDNDTGGRNAIKTAYNNMGNSGTQLDVAELPEGKDPADVSGQVQPFLEAAESACLYLIKQTIGQTPIVTPEDRSAAMRRAKDIAQAHPDPLCRLQYTEIAADLLELPAPLQGSPHIISNAPNRPSPGDTKEELPAAELAVLRYAVHRPEEVISLLSDAFMQTEVGAKALRALQQAKTADGAIQALSEDEETQEVLYGIMCDPPEQDKPINLEPFLSVAIGAAQKTLATRAMDLEPEQIIELQRLLQQPAEEDPEANMHTVARITEILENINDRLADAAS